MTVRKSKKKKRNKSTKKLKPDEVPFPDDPFSQDPFDIAMQQAERQPTVTVTEGSSVSKTTKKVDKKPAMPLEETKTLDIASILKL